MRQWARLAIRWVLELLVLAPEAKTVLSEDQIRVSLQSFSPLLSLSFTSVRARDHIRNVSWFAHTHEFYRGLSPLSGKVIFLLRLTLFGGRSEEL